MEPSTAQKGHRLPVWASVLFFQFSVLILHAGAGEDLLSRQRVRHAPVLTFNPGQMITITVQADIPLEWLRIFYRSEGVDRFQVRNMARGDGGAYAYELDTALLVTPKFDYYLQAMAANQMFSFPSDAPESCYEARGETLGPEKTRHRFPFLVMVNGSVAGKVAGRTAETEDEWFLADGNIRIQNHARKGNLEIDLNMNSANSSHPLEGTQNFNVSNLTLAFQIKGHSLTIGDVSVTGDSQFTIQGVGRRGIAYQYENQRFSLHVFDIGSQQASGWKDLLPRSDLSLVGGIVATNFFNRALSLKLIYVTGRDDPAYAENVGTLLSQRRKGSVWALVPEVRLFGDKLQISGEFARSSHETDDGDDSGPGKSQAWRIDGAFSSGILRLHAGYRLVGDGFNPIGYQFFIDDRRVFDAGLGIHLKRIDFSLQVANERSNVEDDPSRAKYLNRNGGVNLNWNLFKGVSLTLGFRKNAIETMPVEGSSELEWSMLADEYSAGINLTFGSAANLIFSAVRSEIGSETEAAGDRQALGLNVGGSLRFGSNFSLFPSLSFMVSRDDASGMETELFSAYLCAQTAVIPRLLSFAVIGTLFRLTSDPAKTEKAELTASLDVYLGWMAKILAHSALSLKGKWAHSDNEDGHAQFGSIWLQLAFLF